MTTRRSSVVAGLTTLGVAAGLMLGMAGAANAAAPAYEPDPQSNGTLSFYDASGNQITSGSITSKPMAAYTVGSTAFASGTTATLLNAAQPNPSKTTDAWNADTLTGQTNLPITGTSDPANIKTASQTFPVSKGTSGDLSLQDFINEFPNTSGAYANLYQIRLISAAGANQSPTYQVADLLVSGTTWTQVYPTVKTNTSTSLTAAPNPANLPPGSGTSVSVTLTATVTSGGNPFAAGSVQFKNGSTNIGTPVTPNSSGVATTTATFTSTGTFPLSAVFTPTDATSYNGSTGTASEVVTQATATNTSLSVVQDGVAGDDVKLTANVTSGSPAAPFGAGTVAFYDNNSAAALAGTVTQSPTGTFTLDLPSGLGTGGHSIVAKFTPTDTTTYAGSQSAPQAFSLQPKLQGACAQTGSSCTDVQNIQVTVPVGTLVISTPYTSSSPLDLGTLSLNTTANKLTANAPFQHILITDTRSGNLPYSVTAFSSNLTDGKSNPGSTIDSHNVGLTGLVKTATANGFAGTPAFTDAPAANAVAPGASIPAGQPAGLGGSGATVISVDHGLGSLEAAGTLTINAPVTTEPGLFTGTVTFTVG